MNDFLKNLDNIVTDLEGELQQIRKIHSKDFRSSKAYALSGHALTIRQVIRPLKNVDDLYKRLELITSYATALI